MQLASGDAGSVRAEVLDLLFKFARALDEKDWEGYAQLYSQTGKLILPWGETKLRHELATDTEANLGRFVRTQHISANEQIAVLEDAAISRSYLQAVHLQADGGLWTVGGQYDTEVRREDGIWKFETVRLTILWETGSSPFAAR